MKDDAPTSAFIYCDMYETFHSSKRKQKKTSFSTVSSKKILEARENESLKSYK